MKPREIFAFAFLLLTHSAVVVLCAFRVSLFARSSVPAEQHALAMLLITHIATVAMVFPILLKRAVGAAILVCIFVPYAMLASVLSNATGVETLRMVSVAVAWMLALHMIARVMRSESEELIGSALGSGFALGGVGVWYAAEETGGGGTPGALFPLPAAINVLGEGWGSGSGIFLLGILIGSAIFGLALRRRSRAVVGSGE